MIILIFYNNLYANTHFTSYDLIFKNTLVASQRFELYKKLKMNTLKNTFYKYRKRL